MITLIDASKDSLTVSWPDAKPAASGARYVYVLQYKRASADTFETLSEQLTSTQARKKNLSDPESDGFFFRVISKPENEDFQEDKYSDKDWITHAEPFRLLSEEEEQGRMKAPTAILAGSNLAVKISWTAPTDDSSSKNGYELQMRESSGGCPWETIAPSLSGTEVKKKNLASKNGYQFRVRTKATSDNKDVPFSPPSEAVVALGLSDGMKRLFSNTLEDNELLRKYGQPPVSLEDGLGGKEFVLLYASAHWCGPCRYVCPNPLLCSSLKYKCKCNLSHTRIFSSYPKFIRQFTPQLVNWYQSLGPNRTIEIVFLSADHDENSFSSYYSSMPWMAIPFDDDGREGLMGFLRVQGIPRLAVLDGRTGRIIEDNAVGKPMDINRWRKLAAS